MAQDGDLALALRGSFLPAPPLTAFDADDLEPGDLDLGDLEPGATLAAAGEIELNAGRDLVEIGVTNAGDRPIQVGSHYHFIETNAALLFDRARALGRRLNVPAGSSVRFEPGEAKSVTLCEIGGSRVVRSGNLLTDGPATPDRLPEVMDRVVSRGFRHEPAPERAGAPMRMARGEYAAMFGPTVGDRVRLGDTCLLAQVERDYTVYGDECKFGGGKVL